MNIEKALRENQENCGLDKLMKIHIVSVKENGEATAELTLTDELLNPLGYAHGGTIYTLCDVAAGTAAASRGRVSVTLDSSIHYYAPGIPGTTLTATAIERKYGHTVSVYFVEVRDNKNRLIADASFTMFYNGHTLRNLKGGAGDETANRNA